MYALFILYFVLSGSLHITHSLTIPQAMNVQEGLLTNASGSTINKEDFARVARPDVAEELFRMAEKVQKAHLQEEELALLKAISVFCTGKKL